MDASIAVGPGNPVLLEETIGGCLRRIAGEFGEREALVSCDQDLRFTYAELDRLAKGLLAAGLG
jgi:fatty-acyl-CoA synthase